MSFRMLEGTVIDDGRTDVKVMDAMRAEIDKLRAELVTAEKGAAEGRYAVTSMMAVRRQLSPLYRALQMLFGELEHFPEDASDAEPPSPSQSSSGLDARATAVWDSWKDKLGRGSSASRMIDALLMHGPLNVSQLIVAMKAAKQTVYDAASKLGRTGLIDKSGGLYSLKKL